MHLPSSRIAGLRLASLGTAATIATCLLTTSACTSHPSPDPSPSVTALQGLQAQAHLASTRSFSATYRANGGDPPRTDTIRVFRTPSAARIDVEESGVTVRILVNGSGTFSCKLSTGTPPLCVTLAGPGEALPATLAVQLQLQLLFTSAPAEIAEGTGFEVQPAASQVAHAGVPAATCYAIVTAPATADVSPGTYCFADGLLVTAQFRTGSLQLTALDTNPVDGDFTLPASPVPLPSSTPGNTPSVTPS